MIVKNESKIIERCMDSCISVIDAISICDTGSSDNTKELINEYARKKSLPCQVPTYEWKNFGHNRTKSVIEGRKFVRELEWNPAESYLLLMDADMKLEILGGFKKELLTSGGHRLKQHNSSLVYENTRLIRCDYEWKCVGVTHEYWDSPPGCNTDSFHLLAIDDVNDGGAKADKFERDIRLLTEGLKDEPTNARYMFYLAQSYKHTGRNQEAIEWYKKRIEAGGWDEEVWYSHFTIAECYESLHNEPELVNWYLKAYNKRPSRAETLHSLAKYYRNRPDSQNLGYMFAKIASEIPYPSSDMLFISHRVYEYECLVELSICAFYTKSKAQKEEGHLITDRLLFLPNVDSGTKNMCHRNIFFYCEKLKDTKFVDVDVKLPLLLPTSTASETYRPLNPSIVKTGDSYIVNCRTVNYKHEGGYYSYRDGSGLIKTRNILVKYDKNFQRVDQKEIIDNIGGEIGGSNVYGLEDVRIFSWKSGIWALAGNRISCNVPQIVLCELNTDIGMEEVETTTEVETEKKEVEKKVENISFKRKILLVPPKGEQNCEKNWLPYVVDDQLYIIYEHYPFTTFKIQLSLEPTTFNGKVEKYYCSNHKLAQLPYTLDRFRGSARPIPFEDGYIGVIHEVVFMDKRVYLHRFVKYNSNMMPVKTSLAFYFKQKAIEYVAGLELNSDGDQFVMGVGFNDEQAQLCFVSVSTVKSMLYDIPSSKKKN